MKTKCRWVVQLGSEGGVVLAYVQKSRPQKFRILLIWKWKSRFQHALSPCILNVSVLLAVLRKSLVIPAFISSQQQQPPSRGPQHIAAQAQEGKLKRCQLCHCAPQAAMQHRFHSHLYCYRRVLQHCGHPRKSASHRDGAGGCYTGEDSPRSGGCVCELLN